VKGYLNEPRKQMQKVIKESNVACTLHDWLVLQMSWWRRPLCKVYGRKFEHGSIRLGLVHRRKGKYVSDET
jgi:hypothetical protein